MPVQIGSQGQPGFDEPLDLLTDCHRRIEQFLDMLIATVDTVGTGKLNKDAREALEAGLRYFREAAPRHMADEEESLFPRMRRSGSERIRSILETVKQLEADHRRAEEAHERIDEIGRKWLERGRLSEDDVDEMDNYLMELSFAYSRHIAIEDRDVFPMAREALTADDLREVGEEMQRRRTTAKK